MKIIAIHKADNFDNLFSNEDILTKNGQASIQKSLNTLSNFYTLDDQNKNGVVGIEFTVLS